MRIISWNINGIRAVHKKGLFLPFIKKYNPDILLLQETKAQQHQSEVDLENYEEYWNSAEKKGYSGVAIFTKEKPISVVNDIPEKIAKKYKLKDKYGNPNKEGRVIVAEYKNFYTVSVYTPNAKDDLSRIPLRHEAWDPAFLEYMKKLENGSAGSPPKPVIFGGDLNVAHTELDLARPKENVGKKGFTKEERVGIDKIIFSGFLDSFRIFEKMRGLPAQAGHYTWWSHFANARSRNIGWRIDYLFVSDKLKKKIKSAKILPEVMGSDHCPVLIDLN